jgi:hypothetical protein
MALSALIHAYKVYDPGVRPGEELGPGRWWFGASK